ncbi:MAG: metal-dependent hydrolase [endosymbiont of Galathealinum brachiosum]|uniref:Metal-dependent hydrolase n=1 Tax=endosymbiont of Galathealinum brachiosum TaxID=2200906 RepID=A0A370DJ63_9GAMM|nr:MAG: metal-dependent hydrolase [endosymbiont of Galathealinum brachiosum]
MCCSGIDDLWVNRVYITTAEFKGEIVDPVSQAFLGGSLSQSSASNKSQQVSALIIGALAGMAPDLDVLIRSAADPLLFLEFHRQFTHSLIFIPFGSFICALLFYPFFKSKLSFKQIYLFSFLGFATHGLLDACTSYGTQLYWPFSNERVAWNTVSIIDPLFTFPLVIFSLLAAFRKKVVFARIAFLYAVLFLSLGLVQKYRAEDSLKTLALQRGHLIERSNVKPSFANRHVWKTMYEYDGRYYIDAVKLLWAKDIISGVSVQKLNIERDLPWLDINTQQARDIERFRWFSNDYLAMSNEGGDYIIDVRYSFLPNRIESMWGILLSDNKDNTQHVGYKMKSRPDKETVDRFLEMLF